MGAFWDINFSDTQRYVFTYIILNIYNNFLVNSYNLNLFLISYIILNIFNNFLVIGFNLDLIASF